jgi:hypothetical protein
MGLLTRLFSKSQAAPQYADVEDLLSARAMECAIDHKFSLLERVRSIAYAPDRLVTREFLIELGICGLFPLDYLLGTEIHRPDITDIRWRTSARTHARLNQVLTRHHFEEIGWDEWKELAFDRTSEYSGELGPLVENSRGLPYSPVGLAVALRLVPMREAQFAVSVLFPEWLAQTMSRLRSEMRTRACAALFANA